MKKILLFIDSLGAGGAQRQLCGLASLLKSHRYDVKVVTYYNHSFYEYILDENDIAHECMKVNSKVSWFYLARAIRRFHADVVISFQTDPNSMACIAASLCGVPLIVSERNTHQSIGVKDKLIFQLYRLADYVVPNSHSEAKFIAQNFKFLKDKTIAITNFVDLKKFMPPSGGPKEYTAKRRILVVGSVKASKNTKLFIEAFQKAYQKGCNAEVYWYGLLTDDTLQQVASYSRDCVTMLKACGLEHVFRLLPKRTDIDKVYREADIFCLPSLFEGTPNVICEAMASGLPVVASNVCDNAYFVKQGETGWLFNPHSVDDMCRVIMDAVAASDETLANYGRQSRHLVEELCSEEKFVQQYIQLIESV